MLTTLGQHLACEPGS